MVEACGRESTPSVSCVWSERRNPRRTTVGVSARPELDYMIRWGIGSL